MLIAAARRPASSSASNTVTASRDEVLAGSSLKIVSRSERIVPAARMAPNDEPYSTSRRSPRWYQTRCGIPCTSRVRAGRDRREADGRQRREGRDGAAVACRARRGARARARVRPRARPRAPRREPVDRRRGSAASAGISRARGCAARRSGRRRRRRRRSPSSGQRRAPRGSRPPG